MWIRQIKFALLTPSRSLLLQFCSRSYCDGRIIFLKKGFFTTEQSCRCLTVVNFPTYLSGKRIHTGLRQDNVGNPMLDVAPEFSCEKGNDAVLHHEVLAHLNACRSLEEQIHALSSLLSLSDEDLQNRQQFCESLCQAFRLYLPETRVTLFGSSANLLGFKGCDVDACVRTTLNDETPGGNSNVEAIPTLDEVTNGTVAPSVVANLPPKLLMRFLRRVIRKHFDGLKEPVQLIKGRCPIIKFYHKKFDLVCDLSCEAGPAVNNTKLLRFMTHIDSRVRPLIQVLRYWGKTGKFVGGMDMFNSYGFSLLIIFYLQNTSPPVLPPIVELLEKADYLKFGEITDDELLAKSVEFVPASENKQSIGELLRGFFFFYSFWDFSRVMVPLSNTSVPMKQFQPEKDANRVFEFASASVQDPYVPTRNVTSALDFKMGRRFLNCLLEACVVFQNSQTLQPRFNSDNWGLSHLFESSVHYTQEYRKPTEMWTDSFTVELPVQSSNTENNLIQASHLVKTIMQDCFGFQCQEMKVKPREYKTLPLLKFNCQSVHNTWVGRDRVLKEKFSNATEIECLKLEHLISDELIKQGHSKHSLLLNLDCECYPGENLNQPSLNVTLKFTSAVLPVMISIFLREHVPRILKSALQEANHDKHHF